MVTENEYLAAKKVIAEWEDQEVAKKDRLQEEQIYNILETGNLTISKLQKRIADLEKKLEEKE